MDSAIDIAMQLLLSSSSESSSSSSSSSTRLPPLLFDSSSDEEDYLAVRNIFQRQQQHRIKNFVDDVVKSYSEEEFRRHFRLSRTVAYQLIDLYKNSPYYKSKLVGGMKKISAESQCLAFLWFAGNKESYREVSNLFNVTQSAARTHLTNMLEFMFEISTDYIKFPSKEEEKAQKAKEFEQLAGFPNVIGCIDRCYIYKRKPMHKTRSTYVNRHGLIPLTLQGICDANKKFIDVFITSPCTIDDSKIYKISYISHEIPAICGEQYHILGDSAYPLRQFMLTPYKDNGNLDTKKNSYNKRHCQTRVKIENAFGLLKQRFRQLRRLDWFNNERMCKFVLGCCILHNMCIDNGDLWDENPEIETDSNEITESTVGSSENSESMFEYVLKHLGEIKRANIANHF